VDFINLLHLLDPLILLWTLSLLKINLFSFFFLIFWIFFQFFLTLNFFIFWIFSPFLIPTQSVLFFITTSLFILALCFLLKDCINFLLIRLARQIFSALLSTIWLLDTLLIISHCGIISLWWFIEFCLFGYFYIFRDLKNKIFN